MKIIIGEEALAAMQKQGGEWAAYQNMAFDSAGFGDVRFLQYGKDCTYEEPPPQYPDTEQTGPGWRFRLVGLVDPIEGKLIPKEKTA